MERFDEDRLEDYLAGKMASGVSTLKLQCVVRVAAGSLKTRNLCDSTASANSRQEIGVNPKRKSAMPLHGIGVGLEPNTDNKVHPDQRLGVPLHHGDTRFLGEKNSGPLELAVLPMLL